MKKLFLLFFLFGVLNLGISYAQQTEWVNGLVSEIKGQRFSVVLEDGTTKWMTTRTRLEARFVGMTVVGEVEEIGDTFRMIAPTFTDKSELPSTGTKPE